MDIGLLTLIIGWSFLLVWVPFVIISNRKVHPKALFTLFFAELWERFSFYGMRALLVLFMTKVLFDQMAQGAADTRAYGIYGAYGALVYAAPVLGGLLADKVTGFRKAILFGGILMSLGHFTLAFEGNMTLFFAGLALIIVGNGFFKPNISSFLGTFYSANDPRKDGAFTLFYMGVNIGAFLAPLTCGYLAEGAEWSSWSYGFGAAGVGMLLGLIVFWKNLGNFEDKGLPPHPDWLKKPYFVGLSPEWLVIIGSFLVVPIIAGLLNANEYMTILLTIAGVLSIGYLLKVSFNAEDRKEGQRLLVVIVLFFFHMIFWALFEQTGGSLALFADRNVDRTLFSGVIPTSQFQSVNPLFIILLAPVFSWIWINTSKRGIEPSTPMKFVLGLVQLALGFGVLVIGSQFFANDGLVPMIFLILMYFFHTTGELCLSPIGLSLVTKLSPAKIVGLVMGTWFLSISFAHEIAAQLGKLTTIPGADATTQETLQAFSQVYWFWGVLVVGGASAALLILVPTLRRWMHGIH